MFFRGAFKQAPFRSFLFLCSYAEVHDETQGLSIRVFAVKNIVFPDRALFPFVYYLRAANQLHPVLDIHPIG